MLWHDLHDLRDGSADRERSLRQRLRRAVWLIAAASVVAALLLA
ncbi:morphogenic membrane protein MmpB [Streptomyces bohaiensis]|nr:hypothetical protein [Streptomyces bohaiensis]